MVGLFFALCFFYSISFTFFVLASALALGATAHFPTSVFEIPPKDLLGAWEQMRSALYGGTSLALQGLSVSGVTGSRGFVPHRSGADKKEESINIDDLWERAFGVTTYNQTSVDLAIINSVFILGSKSFGRCLP